MFTDICFVCFFFSGQKWWIKQFHWTCQMKRIWAVKLMLIIFNEWISVKIILTVISLLFFMFLFFFPTIFFFLLRLFPYIFVCMCFVFYPLVSLLIDVFWLDECMNDCCKLDKLFLIVLFFFFPFFYSVNSGFTMTVCEKKKTSLNAKFQ